MSRIRSLWTSACTYTPITSQHCLLFACRHSQTTLSVQTLYGNFESTLDEWCVTGIWTGRQLDRGTVKTLGYFGFRTPSIGCMDAWWTWRPKRKSSSLNLSSVTVVYNVDWKTEESTKRCAAESNWHIHRRGISCCYVRSLFDSSKVLPFPVFCSPFIMSCFCCL